jgi:hypothetical protein
VEMDPCTSLEPWNWKIRPDSGARILAAAASLFMGVSSSPF